MRCCRRGLQDPPAVKTTGRAGRRTRETPTARQRQERAFPRSPGPLRDRRQEHWWSRLNALLPREAIYAGRFDASSDIATGGCADLAPCAPADAQGRTAFSPAGPCQRVEERISRAVIALPRGAEQAGGGRIEDEEVQS